MNPEYSNCLFCYTNGHFWYSKKYDKYRYAVKLEWPLPVACCSLSDQQMPRE